MGKRAHHEELSLLLLLLCVQEGHQLRVRLFVPNNTRTALQSTGIIVKLRALPELLNKNIL